ncbi:MAG: hypothetical protein PF448_13490 [Bacteroidales bacterium]|nr:hypothetical protein [Bacteroidales bacterium]
MRDILSGKGMFFEGLFLIANSNNSTMLAHCVNAMWRRRVVAKKSVPADIYVQIKHELDAIE